MLALDLDPGRARDCVDPAAEVERQAVGLGQLLEDLGGQVLADVSPSGGRHVLALFSAALPWLELRDVARALTLRFPAIDTAPMSSLGGQISPPGSRHKSGGWRVLSTPVDIALAAVEHPNGPEVWAALLAELAAELRHVERVHRADQEPADVEAELDDTGVPWVPRLGGRAPLSPELEHVARTGRWDRARHPGRSEARIAVLNAAAARGWQLAEVRAAVTSGAWKGLAGLYERRSEPGRMERLLPLEWRKAIAFVSGEENVRGWHTSDRNLTPPRRRIGILSGVRTCPPVADRDPLRGRGPGAGQGLGRTRNRGAPGAARARPGGDGQRLGHDRVRHQEPGAALGSESPDRVSRPADSP